MTDVKLGLQYNNTRNHLTVYKTKAQTRLRILSTKCFKKSYIYLTYLYEMNLALNNLQWLICHKTQTNKILYIQ